MQNRGTVVRYLISSLVCVAVFFLNGYFILFPSEKSSVFPFPASNGSAVLQPQEITPTDLSANQAPADALASTPTVTVDEQLLATAAKGTVKGKVSEKFITPYTAPVSYDSVYLKNSTSKEIDIKSLLPEKLSFAVSQDGTPQVLIMHTHTTESFLPESRDYYTDKDVSRTRDNRYNMVFLGDIVTQKIAAAGFGVIHDTTVHDYPEYNGSYDRAAETIKNQLKQNKNIKIVLDLHRDAIASDNDKTKTVTEIGSKKAAQIMLVMGCEDGTVKNFPNWRENLKLAVRLQQKIEKMYPTLARPVSFMPRKYNENLITGSTLIEIGTDANSLEEVAYSADLLGNSIVELLKSIT